MPHRIATTDLSSRIEPLNQISWGASYLSQDCIGAMNHYRRSPLPIIGPSILPLPAGEGRGEGESFEHECHPVHGEPSFDFFACIGTMDQFRTSTSQTIGDTIPPLLGGGGRPVRHSFSDGGGEGGLITAEVRGSNWQVHGEGDRLTDSLRLGRIKNRLFLFAFFLCFLALFAPTSARAINSVVTFTNFPSVVSNTYNGIITLQLSGLTNGVTNVVVQKFLDGNTNGVLDSGDLLVQQFRLTVGQASVFTNEATIPPIPVIVTNFMPADTSSTTDQIIVPLNFQNGDFAQSLVGQYLYKISSPSGLFAPVTNRFVVTNTFFSSLVTGAVVNASSPSIPITNAIVLLCVSNQSGALNVQVGAVANNAGVFSLRAPPGDYYLLATKSNFVEELSTADDLQLNAKQTNSFTNLDLTPAAINITGRIINAANSNGLAGVSGVVISTNGFLSFFFTDTNGNFYAPVMTNDLWAAQVDPFAAAFQGCLTWQTNQLLNISNKTVSFTNALPQQTAIFYGVVSNSSAVPMPGVEVYASDTADRQSVGMTDQHGNYMAGALAGTNQWQLSILWPDNPGLTNNYVFSPGYVEAIGLQSGQAIQQDFSLFNARDTISGTVADADGNPIAGAVVFATNGTYQAFSATTASDGSYSLNVSDGSWTVGIVPSTLQSLGYENIPANQTTSVSEGDQSAIVNFTVLACNEIEILTTNLPDAIVGDYYDTNLEADSCQNVTNWFPAYGVTLTSLYDHTNVTYPAGTPIYSDSYLIGYAETYFSFGVLNNQGFTSNCTATLVADPGGTYRWWDENISATVNVTGPIARTNQITFGNGKGATVWTASPTTQNADGSYSTVVTLPQYPTGTGYYYISGGFTNWPGTLVYNNNPPTPSNTVGAVSGAFHSVPTVGNSAIAASSIPYTNLANSVVWITYGTNTGQYFISAYGPQSTNLPPGISVYPNGTLAGTPTVTTTNGIFNFTVAAQDSAGNVAVQPFSMLVYPGTTISGPSSSQAGVLESSNIFQMHVTGVAPGFDYTLLMTTNLASPNWVPIYTTNTVSTNSFIVPDTAATNTSRFYRLQISPAGP